VKGSIVVCLLGVEASTGFSSRMPPLVAGFYE